MVISGGYSAADGHIVWDVDTKGEYRTVNGVAGRGGSMDGPAPSSWAAYSMLHLQMFCWLIRSMAIDSFAPSFLSMSPPRCKQWLNRPYIRQRYIPHIPPALYPALPPALYTAYTASI
jgi:hypothetical protein